MCVYVFCLCVYARSIRVDAPFSSRKKQMEFNFGAESFSIIIKTIMQIHSNLKSLVENVPSDSNWEKKYTYPLMFKWSRMLTYDFGCNGSQSCRSFECWKKWQYKVTCKSNDICPKSLSDWEKRHWNLSWRIYWTLRCPNLFES